MKPIVIIDYGMGNLRSVSKALEHLGARVKVSGSPQDILKAEKIILPGVGAFGDAAAELKKRKLFRPIQDFILTGKKFLGICLGLQLLFKKSEESPKATGLGIFEGEVLRFKSKNVKIPHMGWNDVSLKSHLMLKGIKNLSYFYFVHSFYAAPKDKKIAVGTCRYANVTFGAILGNENVFATQFHPEKSQDDGLKLLKNFIQWE